MTTFTRKAAAELESRLLLTRDYSAAVLLSSEARDAWLEPDLLPLP